MDISTFAYYPFAHDVIDERLVLQDALGSAHLSEKQKEVLEAVYIDGLSQEETAKRLDISQPTVARHIEYAIEKIAASYEDDENEYY